MDDPAEKAKEMLSHLRVHGVGDGPGYGEIKATAALAYAVLAIVDRLDRLFDADVPIIKS